MKIKTDLRKLFADKVLDLTNLGVAATLFNRYLNKKEFSLSDIVISAIILTVGYYVSYLLYSKK